MLKYNYFFDRTEIWISGLKTWLHEEIKPFIIKQVCGWVSEKPAPV